MNLNEMSAAEKSAMLRQLQQEDAANKQKNRAAYEAIRDEVVARYVKLFGEMESQLVLLKEQMDCDINELIGLMATYGQTKRNEQVGFTITATDGSQIIVQSAKIQDYDERAELAAAKIREFVKRRFTDAKDAEFILGLLDKKGNNGNFDSRNIQTLYKHENRYEDAEWREAIALFKESYIERGRKRYYRVNKAQEDGSLLGIKLDFASL